MLITRIELTNYMSHAHTVIEPAAGLTVLVGPNNCGKSAVADALRTVCGFNQRGGAYMVRHGETTASVSVTTSEGSTVTWMRKKDTVSWQVDGRDVHRDKPEDLHEKLRLPMVEAEGRDQEFSVHLADQKQPLFLLGMPPSAPALFFAASSDARHLIAMRQAHKKHVQALEARRKGLEDDLARLGQLLEALEPVPSLNDQLRVTESTYAQIQTAVLAATRLEQDREALFHIQQERDGHQGRAAALWPLAVPPAIEDPTPLDELHHLLTSAARDQMYWSGRQDALGRLQQPTDLAPADRLEAMIEAIESVRTSSTTLEGVLDSLEPLEVPPSLEDPAPFERTVLDFREWRRSGELASNQIASLKTLGLPPAMQDQEGLSALILHLAGQAREGALFERKSLKFRELKDPPIVLDPSPLQDLVARLQDSHRETASILDRTAALDQLGLAPELADPGQLAAALDHLQGAAKEVQEETRHLAVVEEELSLLSKEIQAWLASNGSCPACGQVLTEGALTRGELHGH